MFYYPIKTKGEGEEREREYDKVGNQNKLLCTIISFSSVSLRIFNCFVIFAYNAQVNCLQQNFCVCVFIFYIMLKIYCTLCYRNICKNGLATHLIEFTIPNYKRLKGK